MKKENNHKRYFDDLQGSFFIGCRETIESTQRSLHIHDAFELTLVLSGNVMVDVNEETYAAPNGSLLLFNQLDLHRLYPVNRSGFRRYVLWFKYDYLNELEAIRDQLLKCFYCRRLEQVNCLPLTELQQQKLFDLYQRLQDAFSSKESYGNDILVKLRLAELLMEVNKLYLVKQPITISAVSDDYQTVYQAIQYIQEHLSEDLDQEQLAKFSYTTKRKLCDSFRAITGQTTGQYIINSRLTTAKALLVQGMPVSLVCEKTGFGDYSNFSRTFHKHVGISPKQYAKRNH